MSLLCRNLGYNTDKEVVRNAFKEFGRVVDVYLPLDYMTKQPRGFAFVEMGDRRSAAAAIDGLDGKVIDNRAVKVLFATQKRKRPDQMQTLDPRTARGRANLDAAAALLRSGALYDAVGVLVAGRG